ncbi:hypothetical protein BKA81DRAFT_366145 [Phyllosticta paracitricarpa]
MTARIFTTSHTHPQTPLQNASQTTRKMTCNVLDLRSFCTVFCQLPVAVILKLSKWYH